MKVKRGLVNKLLHQAQLRENAGGFLLGNEKEIVDAKESVITSVEELFLQAKQAPSVIGIYFAAMDLPALENAQVVLTHPFYFCWIALGEKGVLEVNLYLFKEGQWERQYLEMR